jgi:hypothetical protein
MSAFDAAFAIYSTHSHLRETTSNPNAEPRFRVCLPLASAIPAKDFPALWQYAKHKTGLPLDESAKDASRMFYTPAIAALDAPYHFEIKAGACLDWRTLPLEMFASNDKNTNPTTANNQKGDDGQKTQNLFEFHEDRNAELCRRIETQGKATGRGTFEMKCPAHNGNGNSSLFYDPTKQTVACLKKPNPCSYFEILAVFGLPSGHLPSREYAGNDSHSNTKEKKPLKRLKTVRMSDVQAQQVKWLWQDYIPLGAFTILEGEEELGKTWILCTVAGATAQGFGLPNNPNTEPANVLMMSAEDSLSFVIKPRLEAVKAPCEKIIAIDEHFTFDKDGILRLEFELAEHKPKLVIIDPLFSYTGKIKLNDDNDIRSVTDELTRLAEKYECAIVGVRHIGKSKGLGDPRNAGLNGIGWRASARIVLLVGKDPNDERQRAIVQTKNNLAPRIEKAIGYEIIGNEFFWKESTLTAKMMLSLPKDDDERGEQNEAVAFLRQALKSGKCEAETVKKQALKLGITEQRLRTARAKLGIKPKSEGFKDKKWFWELPENLSEDVNADTEDVDKNDNQHLRVNHSDKTSYDNSLTEDVDSAKNQHLRENEQHLRDPQKCPDCKRSLDTTPGGQLFCPLCLTCY